MEHALGWRPTRFRPAALDRGASATAARWIVRSGGRSAFVKIGTTELTAEWIRTEHRNYGALRGWFLPTVVGFDDDGLRPLLALEDMSASTWPPPILPAAPGLAAWVAGYFCSHAGEDPIAEAPHVRPLQLRQARTAFPWAVRALGLPRSQ